MSSEPNSVWTKASKPQTTTTVCKTQTEEAPAITFKKLSEAEPSKNIKIGVHGQAKVGKTSLLLSCPDPIYVIATEPGLVPLMKKYSKKEIFFIDVYEPDYDGMFEVEPTKTLTKIDAAVKYIRKLSLENPTNVRTVGVDSVTDVWKWVQEWMKTEILKIDKTARVRQQWDWGYANTKYQNIIMQLVSLPTNLVLTAQDKEAYAGPGQPSGDYTARWQNQTQFWVDITMGLSKLRDPKTGQIRYTSMIEDARHMNQNLEAIAGVTIDDPTYEKLVAILEGGNNADKK